MGDRRDYIEKAVVLISRIPGVDNIRLSHMYETEPVGYEDQENFYNICLLCDSVIEPEEFLDHIHRIENDLDRRRLIRWGPRTVDIDIILYGDIKMDTERLTIPHPRYDQRAFVLIPMKDLMEYEGFVPEDKSVKRIPWKFEV